MSERLSALIDSELDDDESSRLLNNLKTDPEMRARWDLYHQIGDVLRRAPQFSTDFMTRIGDQLMQEPTILAPKPATKTAPRTHYAMPVAASIAAVGLVGVLSWQMLSTQPEGGFNPIDMASRWSASSVADLDAKAKKMERVHFSQVIPNTYLLAHQEFSPSYAVEGIPAYIRTVSEQR